MLLATNRLQQVRLVDSKRPSSHTRSLLSLSFFTSQEDSAGLDLDPPPVAPPGLKRQMSYDTTTMLSVLQLRSGMIRDMTDRFGLDEHMSTVSSRALCFRAFSTPRRPSTDLLITLFLDPPSPPTCRSPDFARPSTRLPMQPPRQEILVRSRWVDTDALALVADAIGGGEDTPDGGGGPGGDCQVCFSDPAAATCGGCGHGACCECWAGYLEGELRNRGPDAAHLRCFGHRCERRVPSALVAAHLPKGLAAAYEVCVRAARAFWTSVNLVKGGPKWCTCTCLMIY